MAVAEAPSEDPTAAPLSSYSPSVAAGLEILAGIPEATELVDLLHRERVEVRFLPMAPSIYARYSVTRNVVEVDERWQTADAGTLAAVIGHEAVHARDAVSGYLSSGGATACIDSEVRAFRLSAQVWRHVHGPGGKPEPADELERQLNLIAERDADDPSGLERLVRAAYTDQCASVSGQ